MTDIQKQLAEALEDFIDTGFVGGPQLKRAQAVLAAHRQQEARKPLTWQPIETAPRDGTSFLAWRKHAVYPYIIRWDEVYCEWEHVSTGDHLYHLTHWMPLPMDPEAAHGIKGE